MKLFDLISPMPYVLTPFLATVRFSPHSLIGAYPSNSALLVAHFIFALQYRVSTVTARMYKRG